MFARVILCAALILPLCVSSWRHPRILPQAVMSELGLEDPTDSKIVGGHEVIPHSIPFQVSLQEKAKSKHFCGAAVISEFFVLTAAHCCEGYRSKEIVAIAGRHCLDAHHENGEQKRGVKEIIIHEQWRSSTVENDICLLRVGKKFNLWKGKVREALMPYKNEQFEGRAEVSGWGTTSYGGNSSPSLQVVDVPIVSQRVCEASYGAENIFSTMFCAGEKGNDSCQGDSGGPLVCIDGFGNKILCGVVSWGKGCAREGFPGVYTRIASFMPWITKVVTANGDQSTPFTRQPPKNVRTSRK
eukprot:maker-scaffold539_size142544-snap-gene-0.29 protein:Tk01727 transcript:maker-scaffold539_size142544-snap-gene-0.29-mRNA-1 annotation:"intestinal trypsin 5 precursor"